MGLWGLIRHAHWVLSAQFGVDLPRFVRAAVAMPRFCREYLRFSLLYRRRVSLKPCLHDRRTQSGSFANEYFIQDLLVAQWIHHKGPAKHLDIGSRVDGFVAHVASFRPIEVLDVRPLSGSIPNVTYRRGDLMQADDDLIDYCDSLSCLHVLEHLGLGRYGDRLDASGPERGLVNLARILAPGGTLYLSTPIGRERVEFNANRVFDPRRVLEVAREQTLHLKSLTVVTEEGQAEEVLPTPDVLDSLAAEPYHVGIFVFSKGGPAARDDWR